MLESMGIRDAGANVEVVEMKWRVLDAARRVHSFQAERLIHGVLNQV